MSTFGKVVVGILLILISMFLVFCIVALCKNQTLLETFKSLFNIAKDSPKETAEAMIGLIK